MQLNNWNDLRYLVAVKRAGTLAAAARLLGVGDTTVSRRLKVLQSALGAQLYHRQADGSLELSETGVAVAQYAETMEHQVDLIGEILGDRRERIIGSVRLTSVPMVVNRLLVPAVGSLLERHPELQIELIPDSRDLNLTRREADIAIRLARPTVEGTLVRARRIGLLPYAVYASREHELSVTPRLPWVTYDDSMAHLPQARWIARVSKRRAETVSGLRVHDAESAIEAILAFPSKTLLPRAIGEREERLQQLEIDDDVLSLVREIWLLVHSDQVELNRIKGVVAWLGEIPEFKVD